MPSFRAMSSSGPLVDTAVDNEGIATVTMQRLPVNSLNLDLLQAMDKALDEVTKNKCKGMILTSVSLLFFMCSIFKIITEVSMKVNLLLNFEKVRI